MREQESHPVVTSNSIAAAVPQLQNSDAFAAVAQLIQSSQGQKVSHTQIDSVQLMVLHVQCFRRIKIYFHT